MTTPRAAAQTAIAVAGFTPTTERNATRLLARAAEENGHIKISWADLGILWGCSQAVARRHLGYIKAAGIIHYSSNADVYMDFHAWKPSTISTEKVEKVDAYRAWARDIDDDEQNQQQETRVGARISSTFSTENARGRALGGDKGGETNITTTTAAAAGKPPVISQPTATRNRKTDPEWDALCRIYENEIGLLTDVIAVALAALADKYPLTWITEAIVEAVKFNVRKLNYAIKILERWHTEGRDTHANRNPSPAAYSGGKSTPPVRDNGLSVAVPEEDRERIETLLAEYQRAQDSFRKAK